MKTPLRRFLAGCCLGLVMVWVLTLVGCNQPSAPLFSANHLMIGWVSYDTESDKLPKLARFKDYLAQRLQIMVELEPAFNELRAVDQVKNGDWSLVFAPAGLAAIAIAEAQYLPIFPLQGTPNLKSLIVVRQDSPIQSLTDLTNQTIALGEPGSATGYYLPLYDLYGLTLREIRFAPTPKTVLDWIRSGTVVAGALSETDYQTYRTTFSHAGSDGGFRVLHQSRAVPPGAVLLSPTVDRNLQYAIEAAMKEAPSNIAADAGYISNNPVPSFDQLIQLVEKVRPIEANVSQRPAVLTLASP